MDLKMAAMAFVEDTRLLSADFRDVQRVPDPRGASHGFTHGLHT
jgi:hypothetical protein